MTTGTLTPTLAIPVHRIVTDVDAAGWRPTQGEKDRFGFEIPDGKYQTKDFERVIALRARTEAIALHRAEFMRNTDRFRRHDVKRQRRTSLQSWRGMRGAAA